MWGHNNLGREGGLIFTDTYYIIHSKGWKPLFCTINIC
jgi:hypothetical protein